MKERKEQQELLMRQLLDNANIPALSLGWYQKEQGTLHTVAYGKTDTLAPSPVDTNTLFQAASLSKPVSAAIVLDLIDQDKDKPDQDQDKWTLNTPLYKYDPEFGPEELRKDPNYQIITIGMIIGQCSGLANFGENGGDGKKFIAAPNSRFTYSGVALEFLMKVIEKKTRKEWEVIAQDFFKKAKMENSTFKRQLPDGHLHDTPRDIAKAHVADPPNGPLTPLPPLPDDVPGIPAGSMLTTAEDYITFLQYCFKNKYLNSTLLEGDLSTPPPTLSPETSRVKWGLGMGVYSEGDPQKPEKTIAFHWGSNKGSISFCAMDMATGDCVVSFANSMNGPSVFQQVAEPIVGDIKPLFQWLSKYCYFNDVNRPQKPDAITTTVHSIRLLADFEPKKPTDSMQKMIMLMPSISKPELKPVESQEQTATVKAPTPQEIGEEKEKIKEAEKKESAAEAAKLRCRVCFREIAPKRLCSGHGGGGGGGDSTTSDKTYEEKASPGEDKSLTKPRKEVETADELIGEFGAEELDSESSFDPEIIAELIAKELLLVDSDRESMTLTIKLLCEPNVLTEEQREELKKFMEAIIKKFNAFKEENHLSDECIQIIQDEEGNIRSLRITMPTLALYDAFIQRLANNLVPIPSPKAQARDESQKTQRVAPTPLSIEPKPSESTQDKVEHDEVPKEEEDKEQRVFNPSPFSTNSW